MTKVDPYARQKEPSSFWGSGVGTIILLFIVTLTAPGCALLGLKSGKSSDPHAEERIQRTRAFNAQITTSKGTGELTLTQGFSQGKIQNRLGRPVPNRLRMTLLMSGHPVETIAATGQWVTFVSHTGAHPPHSAVSTDPDLNPYINIPLRLSELVSLLLGKVPERPFDRAWTLPDTPDTVFASQSFSPQIQQWVTGKNGITTQYRVIDKKMNVVFQIWYSRFFQQDEFTFPGFITIKDGQQMGMEISFKNIILNIPVKESVFRLTGS